MSESAWKKRGESRDRGWKSRSVCIDGPAERIAISRHVELGERVKVRVSVENAVGGRVTRVAVYESVGECSEVPRADGVGLRFVGYENEQKEEQEHGTRHEP